MALAQTNLVSEGFEGAFPASWSIGDSNPSSGLVYWKDEPNSFGTVIAHTGFWKGYCAGYTNGIPVSTNLPNYANDMQAYMTRTVNFSGYAGANLSFWYNIPNIETCCDRLRVYVDSTNLFTAGTPTAGWVQSVLALNAFVGGSHTLRFEFDSDFSNTAEGAYLDDILVDAANQPFTAALQSLQNANYTGYVLDGDTASGASNIQAQAVFNVENFTGTNTTYTNVLSFRLLDSVIGLPHPIYDLGNTATNASYTYNITNVLSLAAGTNAVVTSVAYIRPATWMSQFTPFYLECRLFTNGTLAQTLTTPPANYYHFTNTVSGDTAYNVLLNLTSAAWSRTYAVQTVSGQNTFQVNAAYEMRRWDDFNLPIAAANVPVVFNFTLRDNSGNLVPLLNSSQTFYDSINSYAFPFLVKVPVLLANSHTLDVQPASQLDSVNKTYYLTVTISHTNDPGTGQIIAANTQGSATNELLHFNGNLFFGAVGTTMTGLAGTPPANAPSGGVIPTTLNPVSGYLTANGSYTFGGGGNLSVNLNANGDATVTAGSRTLAGPSSGSIAGVNFVRGAMTLSSSGASSDFTVTLPTGFGYRLGDTNSMVLSSTLPFFGVALNPSFIPSSDQVFSSAGSTIYAVEESKPVWLTASQITWHVNAGTFDLAPLPAGPYYVRASEYAYLHSVSNLLVDPPNMGDKRSNDKYWLAVNGLVGTPTIRPDAGTNAMLTTTFTFGSGGYRAHFPYDAVVQWSANGVMNVTNDLVPAGSGSSLSGATTLAVPYSRDCSDCSCSGGGTATPAIVVTNGLLTFTMDGGLVAIGTNPPVDLQWGYACSNVSDYAQQALQFTDAAFHMPGVFVRGDQNPLPSTEAPATILNTGFQASDLTVVERPLSFAYSQGQADYAGLNFRCVSDGLHTARSTIAGQNNINWQLDSRSKYYVRQAGVTGIHEAVPGTFPANLSLWGYAFTFTSYGLSYIASQNSPPPDDSIVDGAVTLPFPAQFAQNFSNMTFTCTGAPLTADLPTNEGFKRMVYWAADFKTLSMTFENTNGCSPGAGFLVFGVQGFASHVPQALYGSIGFFPNGDQIPPSFGLPGVTSRIKLPNVINMDGPNKTTYTFTPAQDAYYNTYTNSPGAGTNGWINIFGKLDVPFFEDLQLHLQTSCHTNGVAASNSPIYLSGGWPRPGTPNTDFGWHDPLPSLRTPFETNLFDANNLGWPGSGGGLTIANYRNNQTGPLYHPRAQKNWLNLIPFDYPLSWDTTLRSFKSWQEVTNDLFILTVQHQIKYMDARQAEIDFGAQYDGLPRISIANLAFNAIDQSTGVGDAIVKAAAQPVEDVLSSGLDKMDQLLDTQMKRMMDGVFDKTVNPIIDQFYVAISNDFERLQQPERQQFVQYAYTNTLNYFIGGGPNTAPTTLTTALHDLGNGAHEADNLIGQVRGYLHEATNAIQSVIGVITVTTNGQSIAPVVGLVAQQAGTRPVIPKLLQSLVGDIAPQFIDAVLGPTVSNVIQELDGPIAQISDGLNQTKDGIVQVDAQLASAGEFTSEITNILDSLSGQLAYASAQVSLSVTQYFAQFNYSIDDPFHHLSAADIKNFIRQQIEDQFFATGASAQIQTALRQRLYDVDAAMKGQIDSVFQQMNGAMRSLISESLAQVDDSINKCLGDVSDVIGAGKINGHALINGDSLKELRIDGHFQFKVPNDMEFDAFLLVKELSSDGSSSGCVNTNGPFTEVTIGATHVPVGWLSADLTADAEAKFTFDGTAPFPVNLAGQLALNGVLKFEGFQLHDLAAALSFGKYENYLALKGGVKFDGYDFSGAIFFGRTCTLDPIKLIDPQVADVLGKPPFTGAYCYAQGWLPISELVLDIPPSCVFEISAGIGAGAFFFAEGPTYGGKMFLGVSGQALCIVSIEGDITMVGAATGIPPGDLRFKGHGHFEADLGPCPFCLKLSKDVDIRYEVPSNWHIDF